MPHIRIYPLNDGDNYHFGIQLVSAELATSGTKSVLVSDEVHQWLTGTIDEYGKAMQRLARLYLEQESSNPSKVEFSYPHNDTAPVFYYTCLTCGATVSENGLEKHQKWHSK